ncbi:DUF7551 domain-containing protein [Haladaptatus halobius]|uniref:DUF7551 domain-containing protein n=1 Tax=Haladaptatus halobius TaxID=2884875 RepID=UPI001D0AEDBA|nr:hypothetical protein [Haladaptatus halobius]
MVGRTLRDIRQEIEHLSVDGASYFIRCARTGDRPVPVGGTRFATRTAAEKAVRLAYQYRAALRQYDNRVPYYDLIVCETAQPSSETQLTCPVVTNSNTSEKPATLSATDRIEFCHDVVVAIFESLSAQGYTTVETAIMEKYLDTAETITNRDELCLLLLEHIAVQLETQLSASEQASVLTHAASRLPSPSSPEDPIEATCTHLQAVSLIGGYTVFPISVDRDECTRLWTVRIDEYALSPRQERLPTLPLAVDMLRRLTDHSLAISRANRIDDRAWQLRMTTDNVESATGLVSVHAHNGE